MTTIALASALLVAPQTQIRGLGEGSRERHEEKQAHFNQLIGDSGLVLSRAQDEGDWLTALQAAEKMSNASREVGLFVHWFSTVDQIEALLELNRVAEAASELAAYRKEFKTGSGSRSPNPFIDSFVAAMNGTLSEEGAAKVLEKVYEHHEIAPGFFPVKTQKQRLIAVRLARTEERRFDYSRRAIYEARTVLALDPSNPLAAYYVAKYLGHQKQEPEVQRDMWSIAAKLPGPTGDEARNRVKRYERQDEIERRRAGQTGGLPKLN